jgi:prolyl oligopeptidase
MARYSAYHNIEPGRKYPPLLMTTSTRDDRVHPYHARSFVKRLREATPTEGLRYYENLEGGHGGAADSKQEAFMATLYFDFLKSTIGKGIMK